MRHPLYGKELEEKCEEFAARFVEASGDRMSLTRLLRVTVEGWLEHHEGIPEDTGE